MKQIKSSLLSFGNCFLIAIGMLSIGCFTACNTNYTVNKKEDISGSAFPKKNTDFMINPAIRIVLNIRSMPMW